MQKWGIYLLGAGCMGETGIGMDTGYPIGRLKAPALNRVSNGMDGVHMPTSVQEFRWHGAK